MAYSCIRDKTFSDRATIQDSSAYTDLREAISDFAKLASIDEFLSRLTTDHPSVEFYRFSQPYVTPGTSLPRGDDITDAPQILTRIPNHQCFDGVQCALAEAIAVAPSTVQGGFNPHYCVVVRQTQGPVNFLWVDATQLTMQLWVSGSGQTGACGIKKPKNITVSAALEKVAELADTPRVHIFTMLKDIRAGKNVELMSLDPGQANDVFGQKHRKALEQSC